MPAHISGRGAGCVKNNPHSNCVRGQTCTVRASSLSLEVLQESPVISCSGHASLQWAARRQQAVRSIPYCCSNACCAFSVSDVALCRPDKAFGISRAFLRLNRMCCRRQFFFVGSMHAEQLTVLGRWSLNRASNAEVYCATMHGFCLPSLQILEHRDSDCF